MRPDVVSCGTAIVACERAGEWRTALYILNRMERPGMERPQHPRGVRGGVKGGVKGGAKGGVKRQSRPPPAAAPSREAVRWPRADAGCYRAAINAVGRGAGWRDSLALLHRMGGPGRPPRDARTYGPVIMAAARERRVGEALRLTEEAEAAGLRLDEHAAAQPEP